MLVGHNLVLCTSTVSPIEVEFPPGKTHLQADGQNKRRRLIIVDTPGFDNASVDDLETYRGMARSLVRVGSPWQEMSILITISLADIAKI